MFCIGYSLYNIYMSIETEWNSYMSIETNQNFFFFLMSKPIKTYSSLLKQPNIEKFLNKLYLIFSNEILIKFCIIYLFKFSYLNSNWLIILIN